MLPLADAAICRSGSRLAGGHQRHARDDGVQFQARRLFQDDRGPRADADAGHSGRARGEDPEICPARLSGKSIGTFDCAAGEYTGRWFDEKFAKSRRRRTASKPERVWDKAKAEAIRDKCLGKPGIVTEESKPTTSMSPLLYDLTSLQREANSRFGFQRQEHAGPGAGALRKAQGADLSANRFARAAGGLHRHGEEHAGDAGRRDRLFGRLPTRF